MRPETLPFTPSALWAAHAGGLRPAAVIAEALARLTKAEAEAEALGAFGPSRPVWGIPFVVQDTIDLAGMQTTAACPAPSPAPSWARPKACPRPMPSEACTGWPSCGGPARR